MAAFWSAWSAKVRQSRISLLVATLTLHAQNKTVFIVSLIRVTKQIRVPGALIRILYVYRWFIGCIGHFIRFHGRVCRSQLVYCFSQLL